jgi:hypothetical protein
MSSRKRDARNGALIILLILFGLFGGLWPGTLLLCALAAGVALFPLWALVKFVKAV